MRTRDLYFAAFLVASEHVVSRTERPAENPRVLVWVFDVPSEAYQAFRAGYLTGQALVNARAYADALRNLKNMIHRDDEG